MNNRANRRGHFRLRYPPGAEPVLTTGSTARTVVELSERGLRFSDGGRTATLAERVSGVLRFPDGTELAVEGAVVRSVGGWIAVRLTRGVHLGRMIAEQRRILREYPGFLRPVGDED
ncbi:MAG: PilZ domain-containing protein [Planctomycetes bacterium]|nr:PilZ domain-containing protein [Planctomycetota bacterium]